MGVVVPSGGGGGWKLWCLVVAVVVVMGRYIYIHMSGSERERGGRVCVLSFLSGDNLHKTEPAVGELMVCLE